MLGEDGPCHEATASVSAMAMAMEATATMRIARACRRLAGNSNAVTAPCVPHSWKHYRAVAAKTRPFQNGHRVRPDTLLASG